MEEQPDTNLQRKRKCKIMEITEVNASMAIILRLFGMYQQQIIPQLSLSKNNPQNKSYLVSSTMNN